MNHRGARHGCVTAGFSGSRVGTAMRTSALRLAMLGPIAVLAAVAARAAEREGALVQSAEQPAIATDQQVGAREQSAAVPAQTIGQADQTAAPMPQRSYQMGPSGVAEYFANWSNRVHAALERQPYWTSALVTVPPLLEEAKLRYDQVWEHLGAGAKVNVFDAGKGLQLIPTETNELQLNMPPYQERIGREPARRWADWPFLTIKQRLLSANEQSGNYILTAFLGFQAPIGAKAFTEDSWVVTPTLAGGKRWGDFIVQTTVGFPIPTDHQEIIGTSFLWNTAFQYDFDNVFWPEFEVSTTHWFNGLRGGKTQVFLTPGLILGGFPLFNSAVRARIGGGYQFAVTPKLTTTPVLTPVYNHAWILTARLVF